MSLGGWKQQKFPWKEKLLSNFTFYQRPPRPPNPAKKKSHAGNQHFGDFLHVGEREQRDRGFLDAQSVSHWLSSVLHRNLSNNKINKTILSEGTSSESGSSWTHTVSLASRPLCTGIFLLMFGELGGKTIRGLSQADSLIKAWGGTHSWLGEVTPEEDLW